MFELGIAGCMNLGCDGWLRYERTKGQLSRIRGSKTEKRGRLGSGGVKFGSKERRRKAGTSGRRRGSYTPPSNGRLQYASCLIQGSRFFLKRLPTVLLK